MRKGFKMNIILASQSPRRKKILSDLGYSFKVQPALRDEIFDSSMDLNQSIEWVAYQRLRKYRKPILKSVL